MKSGLSTQSVRSFLSGFDRVDVEAWSSHRNEVGTQGERQLSENVYGEGGRRSSGDAEFEGGRLGTPPPPLVLPQGVSRGFSC